MFSFQSPAPAVMVDFLQDINTCVVPSEELICAEYCFRHCVNPYQHPCLDPNIHHLTALLTALSNTCGGVVLLCTPEKTVLEEREFRLFTSRLLSLPDIDGRLLKVSQTADKTSWAIIAKKSNELLSCNFDNNCMKLCIDMSGQLQGEQCSLEISQKSDPTPGPVPDEITDVEDNPSSTISEANAGDIYTNIEVETVGQSPADFSTFHELNWDQNRKNWQENLNETKQSPEELIASCDICEPRLPMQITPDKDSSKGGILSA